MSDKLSDIRARIGATRQLETVITAMRGVAAARAREAQARLPGVRAFAEALGEAIGAALALCEEPEPAAAADGRIILAFVAEQGFAGAFSERVLAAVRRTAPNSLPQGGRALANASLFLVGARGAALALEQGFDPARTTPMAAHIEDAPALADRIAEALYERIEHHRASRVTLIHAAPKTAAGPALIERPLIPLDLARFPARSRSMPPLVHLPARELVAGLLREYVFAELCEAVVLSFAAENEARMQAMIAAKTNVRKTLDELTAEHRRLRQEEITEEIIELAAR